MRHHQFGWRVGQPLRKRQVLVKAALEHFQEDEICIPRVFDVMQKRLFDVADISRLKVHRASLVTRRHHCHSCLAGDVILPLVGIGMPVQFP